MKTIGCFLISCLEKLGQEPSLSGLCEAPRIFSKLHLYRGFVKPPLYVQSFLSVGALQSTLPIGVL